ncbi:hypothetical protein BJH92_20990 [Paenibacillus polymyxa]|nr:hypothetical protein BJH92_20990 [Paenibacillus polymyxa]KJK32557.1 hypothetical protein TY89_02440 [Paenibacillus polymyxa]
MNILQITMMIRERRSINQFTYRFVVPLQQLYPCKGTTWFKLLKYHKGKKLSSAGFRINSLL